jgi:hypothetical protein
MHRHFSCAASSAAGHTSIPLRRKCIVLETTNWLRGYQPPVLHVFHPRAPTRLKTDRLPSLISEYQHETSISCNASSWSMWSWKRPGQTGNTRAVVRAPDANPGGLPHRDLSKLFVFSAISNDVESRTATVVDFVAVKASPFQSFQQHERILATLSQAISRRSWPSTPRASTWLTRSRSEWTGFSGISSRCSAKWRPGGRLRSPMTRRS